MFIKTHTWNKDSNELFDYECSDLHKNPLSVGSKGFLLRIKDQVKFTADLDSEDFKNSKVLMKVNMKQSSTPKFQLISKFAEKNHDEMPWISLRYMKQKNKSNGYILSQGDVIKLGRIKFQVREIKLESKNSSNLSSYNDNNNNKYNPSQQHNIVENNQDINNFYKKTNNFLKSSKNKKVCRICYCDDQEVDSPLINPCNCSGGVKYIHLVCLQQWLKSRCIMRSVSNDSCMIYTIKQIECEICKQVLPDYVKYKGKLYEIWEFVKPSFKNYVCLETINTERQSMKNLFLINLDSKNNLKIGRSHDADLRLTDISVSRFHAQIIRNSDDTLRIEDNNSKFGSLVLLQHPKVSVNSEQNLPLQIGRTLILASTRKPFRLFPCFSCGYDSSKDHDYSTINEGYIEIDKIFSVKVQNDREEDSSVNSVSAGVSNKNKDDVNITDENIHGNHDYNFNMSHNKVITSNNEVDDINYLSNMNTIIHPENNFITEMNFMSVPTNRNLNVVNNYSIHEINTLNYIDNIPNQFETIDKNEKNSKRRIDASLIDLGSNKAISNVKDLINPNNIDKSASPNRSNKIKDTCTGIKQPQRNSMMNYIKDDRKSSCLNFNHRKLSEVNTNSPMKLNLDAFKKYEEDIVNNEVENIIGIGPALNSKNIMRKSEVNEGGGYNNYTNNKYNSFNMINTCYNLDNIRINNMSDYNVKNTNNFDFKFLEQYERI